MAREGGGGGNDVVEKREKKRESDFIATLFYTRRAGPRRGVGLFYGQVISAELYPLRGGGALVPLHIPSRVCV